MSGHSKWATIRRAKEKTDAKKGKVFTKVTKDIILAAKGGGDPNLNARLRAVIAKAKAANMPNDKIETAIKKGTGELAGGEVFEMMYEGYAQGGVAMLVEVATDNKIRTIAEVRHIISKGGGSMGDPGSVAWMFEKRGVFVFDKAKYTEDKQVSVKRIHVDTDDKGKVQLTGTARSKAEKQKAAEIAKSVEGVVSVDNRIKIAPKKQSS